MRWSESDVQRAQTDPEVLHTALSDLTSLARAATERSERLLVLDLCRKCTRSAGTRRDQKTHHTRR